MIAVNSTQNISFPSQISPRTQSITIASLYTPFQPQNRPNSNPYPHLILYNDNDLPSDQISNKQITPSFPLPTKQQSPQFPLSTPPLLLLPSPSIYYIKQLMVKRISSLSLKTKQTSKNLVNQLKHVFRQVVRKQPDVFKKFDQIIRELCGMALLRTCFHDEEFNKLVKQSYESGELVHLICCGNRYQHRNMAYLLSHLPRIISAIYDPSLIVNNFWTHKFQLEKEPIHQEIQTARRKDVGKVELLGDGVGEVEEGVLEEGESGMEVQKQDFFVRDELEENIMTTTDKEIKETECKDEEVDKGQVIKKGGKREARKKGVSKRVQAKKNAASDEYQSVIQMVWKKVNQAFNSMGQSQLKEGSKETQNDNMYS